jgi:hypothetical protein
MIRFSNDDDYLELELITSDSGLDASDDLVVSMVAHSAGFKGSNQVTILANEVQNFCRDLTSLEKTRKGAARLRSLSPAELDLTIESVSGLGHMGVVGSTGYAVEREHGSIVHRVELGFEFDPAQLLDAVRAPWVVEAAS